MTCLFIQTARHLALIQNSPPRQAYWTQIERGEGRCEDEADEKVLSAAVGRREGAATRGNFDEKFPGNFDEKLPHHSTERELIPLERKERESHSAQRS